MPAREMLRLERYMAYRPCGPEQLDLLQALISSAVLAAAGARVSPADCLPAWHGGLTDQERVALQVERLKTVLGNPDGPAV